MLFSQWGHHNWEDEISSYKCGRDVEVIFCGSEYFDECEEYDDYGM